MTPCLALLLVASLALAAYDAIANRGSTSEACALDATW